jgi:hypothetical protein
VRFQVRTLQVPTKWGMGAFLPTLTFGGAPATNGQNKVCGMPGTVRIPSPRPVALVDGELGGPFNQPSSVAPEWFLPSIYYNPANRSLHFPGRLMGDNVLPVPIPNVRRTAIQAQHRVRVGGRTATAALRPFTQWPTYNGRSR